MGLIILDYNPKWPHWFDVEKTVLLEAVGAHVTAIEHIGSTSVPGLAAKPVIDIMMGVRTLVDADNYCIQSIVALGYEYVSQFEDVMPQRRYFRKIKADAHSHHIHLVEINSEFWERHLLFRDYLRADAGARRDYERLKRELAAKYDDTHAYTDAKTDFIRAAETQARCWKASICES